MKSQLLKIKTKPSEIDESVCDHLSVNNPVGRRVKMIFDEIASDIDLNWHPREQENFAAYKTRLLRMLLGSSASCGKLRDVTVMMYKGNDIWSLRYSAYKVMIITTHIGILAF